jgi:cytochrome o ubiquinol oxidase operon protein cyoD
MNQSSLDTTGAATGSFRSYTTGFILSIVLTAIPFWLVMHGTLSRPATLTAIFGAACMQILVHLYYFLHLNTSSRMRWNLLAFIFAALIMVLIIGGTVWIMANLRYHLT